jgi:FMNH2-dependent dimethyl sulfone monooxygenase
MRYGYWMPVFGGWLRNIEDEHMQASWGYVKKLTQRSETLGYDLTLIAELNLNDIKGPQKRCWMPGRRQLLWPQSPRRSS